MTTPSAAWDQRVFYVQYANPAAYPPLLHSARILADDGWDVQMLGTTADGAETLRVPSHDRIKVATRALPPPGPARRLHYARFVAAAVREVARVRPDWVYASDPFSAPVAAAIARLGLARVVYHEHDAPGRPQSTFMRAVVAARRVAASRADLLVVPNEDRLERLVAESGRSGASVCVWNCPSMRDVAAERSAARGPLTLYYHGSLNTERLPLELLKAMAQVTHPYRLIIVGYETMGNSGFSERILAQARADGVAERIMLEGSRNRDDAMAICRTADVGLSLMPMRSDDLNMRAMAGASNKPFDYLASGLALLVSDLPEWNDLYVTPGYALSVDPSKTDSLVHALNRLAADPARVREMGEAGRRRILGEWNYEAAFAPVHAQMEAALAHRAHVQVAGALT